MSLEDERANDPLPITFSYPKTSGYMPHSREKPVVSYGIILFTRTTFGEVKFLVYQRRETFEYMEFMKGGWKTVEDVEMLFRAMSSEERIRIADFTFEELWNDLWVIQNFRFFKEGFPRSQNKYLSIRDKIPEILERTTTEITEPPWGFPKGKKDKYSEPNLDCALREFREETGINTKGFIIHRGHMPYNETFRGSNGKLYSTRYYLAETKVEQLPSYYPTPWCIRKQTVSSEALSVKWMGYPDVLNVLSRTRKNMIRAIYKLLMNV